MGYYGLISNNKTNMYESLKKSIQESDEIIMNVSFIRDSGMKLLIRDLKEAKERGIIQKMGEILLVLQRRDFLSAFHSIEIEL